MTDETSADEIDALPDLFAEFFQKHNDLAAEEAAQMVQAEALCRIAAIQQRQLEIQEAHRRRSEEMMDEVNGLLEDSPIGGTDTDDYRFEPGDSEEFDEFH